MLKSHKPHDNQTQKDAEFLFFKDCTGHVGYLQYGSPKFTNDHVMGAILWTDVRNHPDYYWAQEDDHILLQVIDKISEKNISACTLIDLGPGDIGALKTKTLPLINAMSVENYVAVDMSALYAKESAKYVSYTGKVKTRYIVSNFLNDGLPPQDNSVFIFMGGGTISNLAIDIQDPNVAVHLVEQFKKLRDIISDSGHLLLGFDGNQDHKSLDASYQNKPHGRLIEDILWRIKRDTDIILDPSCYAYHGEWMPQQHRYAHCVIATKENVISLEGKTRIVQTGEVFHLDNSYKFPAELMQQCAEQAGWKMKELWTNTGRAHYILLQAI